MFLLSLVFCSRDAGMEISVWLFLKCGSINVSREYTVRFNANAKHKHYELAVTLVSYPSLRFTSTLVVRGFALSVL